MTNDVTATVYQVLTYKMMPRIGRIADVSKNIRSGSNNGSYMSGGEINRNKYHHNRIRNGKDLIATPVIQFGTVPA